MKRTAKPEPRFCACCFIVPPHILSKLSTSGDRDLAAAAARTVRITNSLQAFRSQLSTGAPSAAALVRPGLRRQAFDCKGTDDLPGDPARAEADPPVADAAINQAFDNAGTSWKFYKQIFGRESVDGHIFGP